MAAASTLDSTECDAACVARCAALLEQQPAAALEPWRIDDSKFGWRYHICGAPVQRQKSALVSQLSQPCRTQSVGSCAMRCSARQHPTLDISRNAMPPRVRELLEALSAQLLKRLGSLPPSEGRCFVTNVTTLPTAAKLLLAGLTRPRCAVVGSSPSLLRADRGREIDAHDVIFRFNFAPTRGYERSVGTRTTVRLMGRSWVWNETGGSSDGAPLLLHRYNNREYFDEDLKLNRGFPIATLEHLFAKTGLNLQLRLGLLLKRMKKEVSKREFARLAAFRYAHPFMTHSTGFGGLLFAMHACSEVSVYGYDVSGSHPGHYFNDATEGSVARLQEQVVREPFRLNSLSVDPGIEGVKLDSRMPSSAHHADRATEYRTWIEQQYTNTTPAHPYPLERGLIRMFVERGCVQLHQ